MGDFGNPFNDDSQESMFEPGLIGEEDKSASFDSYLKRNNNRMLEASQAAATGHDIAGQMLRDALRDTKEVSPQQALAAGILAILPAIGGYMGGRMVGKADISPHAKFTPEQLSGLATGPAAGAVQGIGLGRDLSSNYLKSLEEASKEKERKDFYLAQQEADWQNKLAEQHLETGQEIGRETRKAEQEVAMMPLEEAKGMRELEKRDELARGRIWEQAEASAAYREPKAASRAEEVSVGIMADPRKQAAFVRISLGEKFEEPGDRTLLTPEELTLAMSGLRSTEYGRSVGNTQGRFIATMETTQDPRYINVSGAAFDKSLNDERAKLKGDKAMALNAMENLAQSYKAQGLRLDGPESMKQRGLASVAFTAARTLSGAGANLTGNEKSLVAAMAAPNIDTDNVSKFLFDWIRQQGSFEEGIMTVRSVVSDAFDSKLAEGYGQASPEYAARNNLKEYRLGGDIGEQVIRGQTGQPAKPTDTGMTVEKRLPDESIAEWSKRTGN